MNDLRTILWRVLLALAGGISAAEPSKGYEISDDYALSVNGKTVEVIRVPIPEERLAGKNRHPYSFAPVTVEGEAELTVTSGFFPEKKRILKATAPKILVLEPNGRHRSLVIALSKPEANPPRPDDPKVRYFGPGIHREKFVRVGSGETLYLAPGAWVEGVLLADGDDITICGSGVISGACWPWRKGPKDAKLCLNGHIGHQVVLRGRNITMRDITTFSPFGWATVLSSVTNCVIDNYKVIAGRCPNDDGIDCCGVKDTVIRNSFIHSQDDCIAVKWSAENLAVTNCIFLTDEANIVRMGYECGDHAKFENVVFRDIDVLHLAMAKRTAEKYWCNCCLLLQASHEAVMRDILFENIRLKNFEDGRDELFVAKTMHVKSIAGDNGPWTTPLAGHIDGVTLRNITGPRRFTRADIKLIEKDQGHRIENVKFLQPPSPHLLPPSGNI
jgi:hypothetical protein